MIAELMAGRSGRARRDRCAGRAGRLRPGQSGRPRPADLFMQSVVRRDGHRAGSSSARAPAAAAAARRSGPGRGPARGRDRQPGSRSASITWDRGRARAGRDPGLHGDRALPRREDRAADLHAPDGVERLCRDDRIAAASTGRAVRIFASGAVSGPLPGLLVTGCLVLSVMLTIQSAYTLYLMLYTWDQPEAEEAGQGAGRRSCRPAVSSRSCCPPGTRRTSSRRPSSGSCAPTTRPTCWRSS